MDNERAFEIAIAKHLGYTVQRVDECNGRANQWTLVAPDGWDYKICMRTEDEVWQGYAPDLGDFDFVRFSRVSVVATFGAMGWKVVIGDEPADWFIDKNLDRALRDACRHWLLQRYGEELKV